MTSKYGKYLALLIAFTLSGAAGLIYQSVWTSYLGLFLGHSAYAQTLVLMIFMGGLALGAWSVSIAKVSTGNLIRKYALIEIALAIFGVVFHPLFKASLAWSLDSVFPALGNESAIGAFKWLLATLLIFCQCFALGMTFPLLSAGVMRTRWVEPGNALGFLYFANSIGAAIGVLVAAFVLVPSFGFQVALMWAAMLNIAAGMVTYALSKDLPEEQEDRSRLDAARRPSGYRFVLLASLVTGLTSFVYEVGWIRMLSMVLGSTVHAFELMLSAFILGLALGGLWIRNKLKVIRSHLPYVGVVQILMGLAVIGSAAVYSHAFGWVGFLVSNLAKTDGGYSLYNVGSSIIAMVIMLPATFFAGMTLPLFTYALLKRGASDAVVGKVYSANTIGAIVGVVAAVHLLLPHIGLKWTLIVAAAIDIALGVALLLRYGQRSTARNAVCAASIAVACLAGLFIQFDPKLMASGVFRHGRLASSPGDSVIFHKDGKTASIAVVQRGTNLKITTNGKPDASIELDDRKPAAQDEITMVMAAALPMSLRPDAKTVANIGFGSGLTTHALLANNRYSRVDSIEIEPAMIEGAKLFEHRVARAYSDPRSRIVIDDAKSYFSASGSKYDIIISEPSNPWVAGVAALFSEEFYSFVPRHLNDAGLFVQWIQIYETDVNVVASVLKGIKKHFKDYRIYFASEGDLLVVASPKGSVGALDDWLLKSREVSAELSRVGVRDLADIESRLMASKLVVDGLADVGDMPANSDYFPVIAHNAARLRFKSANSIVLSDFVSMPVPINELLGAPRSHWLPADSAAPTAGSVAYERESRTLFEALMATNAFVADAVMLRSIPCNDSDQLASYHVQYHNFVTPHLAMLSAERASALLGKLDSIECSGKLPKLWRDLYASVAARDAARMLQSAAAASQFDGTQSMKRYVALSGAVAATQLGDKKAAAAFLAMPIDALQASAHFRLAMQVIGNLNLERR